MRHAQFERVVDFDRPPHQRVRQHRRERNHVDMNLHGRGDDDTAAARVRLDMRLDSGAFEHREVTGRELVVPPLFTENQAEAVEYAGSALGW